MSVLIAMIEEKIELKQKLRSLELLRASDSFLNLSATKRGLISKQLVVIMDYCTLLSARIAIEQSEAISLKPSKLD